MGEKLLQVSKVLLEKIARTTEIYHGFWPTWLELSQELNENLTDLPIIVLVSKSDLQPDQGQIDELAKTLQIVAESKTSNLYYPKPLLTSAENHDGWASLIYIARHLYEHISGKRTDDLYW